MRKKLLLGLLVGSLAGWAPLEAAPVMRVHFIDVGQGDATLVEFPCGSILIDAGGERWPTYGPARYLSTPHLVDYLTEFFDDHPELGGRLDVLFLTHPHADHTRGAPQVVEIFKPRNVVTNGKSGGSGKAGQKAARKYARKNPDVEQWYVLERKIDKGEGLRNPVIDPLGDCEGVDPEIRVLWGQVKPRPSRWHKEDFGNGNNHSLAIRIDFGKASALLTGDLEEGETRNGKKWDGGIESLLAAYRDAPHLLDVDVYQVGHHGSYNGTTPELLEAMSPEIAVISAGPPCERHGYTSYSYGHPREVTVEDLIAGVSGVRAEPVSVRTFLGPGFDSPVNFRTVREAIYSTGWDGNVILEATASGEWKVIEMSGGRSCE